MNRQLVPPGDAVAGISLAGLGTFVLVQSAGWTYLGPDGPGPGFFPRWYGGAIVVLSLALAIGRLRRGSDGEGRAPPWRGLGRALGAWGAFAAAIALLETLGFVLAFGLLVLFLVRFTFAKGWTTAAFAALACPLAFELLFPVALGVELPIGLLGL